MIRRSIVMSRYDSEFQSARVAVDTMETQHTLAKFRFSEPDYLRRLFNLLQGGAVFHKFSVGLKRYRVAAGNARPLRDYLLLRDFSIIRDYRLPRDPSYSTITVTSATTSALAIPL